MGISLLRINKQLVRQLMLMTVFLLIGLIFVIPRNSKFQFGDLGTEKFDVSKRLATRWKDNAEDFFNASLSIPYRILMESPVSLFLEQDDAWLIKFIRDNYIEPPSTEPYNLNNVWTSSWQANDTYELLQNKKNGIFVDCGAHNGEYLSNTLALENHYGWTGALIEPNPSSYENLKTKHRKAFTIPACLSPYSYPKKMMFKLENVLSKLTKTRFHDKEGYTSVQCFPLYSLLLALNLTKIDYFSLDVEGSELDVLKTLQWDKVDITVLTVEFNNVRQGKAALKNFMKKQGYVVYIDGSVKPGPQNVDYLFVKKSYLENYGKITEFT